MGRMEVREHVVTQADTAEQLGTGDMPVLATPRLITWIEQVAFEAAAGGLAEGQTTVGTLVKVEHVRGTPIGSTVFVRCSKPVSDGHRLILQVTVADRAGDDVAHGEIHRAVVDRDRFMRRFGCTPEEPSTPG